MSKVSFHTLGCKVNQYETDAMIEIFQQKGYEIVDFNDVADICIINTCTVTNVADKKSRKMMSKARKLNPNGVIVVVGCYAQIAENQLKEHPEIDLLIGNNNKSQVADIVESFINEHTRSTYIEDINDQKAYEELWISKVEDKKRAHIKVQDGCNQFCSYCIIPYTRGRVRSREPQNVVKEVTELVNKGYKEIVITGIHLASYGTEFNDYTLSDLLKDLNEINGLERIRLGSLEPTLITDDFINKIVKLKKVCPHFHLSLQSGCDRTLKRMNRKYTTYEYLESVLALKKAYDEPAITTDIIVGFPGETDEEFYETLKFIKNIEFADIHVFKYSKREGTKAAQMECQVPENTKHHRSKILIGLRNQLNNQYLQKHIGKILEVIFEETVKEGSNNFVIGHASNYMKVRIEKPSYNIERKLASVLIEDSSNECLIGRLAL